MAGITILGTGSYTPPFSLTNKMLEAIVETDDEWIRTRTGISARAVAGADETTLSMGKAAALKALAAVDKSNIGLIIAATITPDYLTPSLSALLQRELDLPEDVLAIDINCACSGFVMALRTAYAYLGDMPSGKTALVLGCEMLSRVTDYTDRTTCVLFGDGAGAAVVQRDSDESSAFVFDGGTRGDDVTLFCKSGYLCNSPFIQRPGDADPAGIAMNGQEVFRFAVETCSASVGRVLYSAGIAPENVQHFIFHQANKRIIDGIAKRLSVPIEKCVVNIQTHGNTSSATCAIALDELFRSGKVKPGDGIVVSAFGGGLAYASVYFTQNKELL